MRYIVAIFVPLLLFFCGAFAKKLVRGTTWERRDFFLGVELTLAAMSSGLIYFFELVKFTPNGIVGSPNPEKVAETAIFVALCFFLLFWVLSTHQDWEKVPPSTKGQFSRLVVFSNFVGAGLLCAFALIVKGI